MKNMLEMSSEEIMEKHRSDLWVCEVCKKKVRGAVKAMAITGHHKNGKGKNCEGIFYPKGVR